MFYSALLLTGVNLLLRLVGTGFQVWLCGRIGPAGVGLLQLLLSVSGFAMVAATAGIRTGTMYLSAGAPKQNLGQVLSSCFLYSLCFSSLTAVSVLSLAPAIAEHWIGSRQVIPALQLMAGFLPCLCLGGVLSGYFTATGRIRLLAAVEMPEQLLSMGLTLAFLRWAGEDPGKVCCAVIAGSSLAGCATMLCLVAARIRERGDVRARLHVALWSAALPLALGDLLRTGISTAENLMVPGRLALHPGIRDPLASFGMLTGMVFPILMFPACFLFGLNELLIPELARCSAAGDRARISGLAEKSLTLTFFFGLATGGLLFLLAEPLCLHFYGSREAGLCLRCFAPLVPMLYCDGCVDAMTKGLGLQKVCVRYNIVTNCLDLFFLWFLLPGFGIQGYFVSFLLTHALNFLLSLGKLLKLTGIRVPLLPCLTALAAAALSTWAAGRLPLTRWLTFPIFFLGLLHLAGLRIRTEKSGLPEQVASE